MIFLEFVRHSVNYSFEDIKLFKIFSVLIHDDLRKVLNYFAAKSEQKNIFTIFIIHIFSHFL